MDYYVTKCLRRNGDLAGIVKDFAIVGVAALAKNWFSSRNTDVVFNEQRERNDAMRQLIMLVLAVGLLLPWSLATQAEAATITPGLPFAGAGVMQDSQDVLAWHSYSNGDYVLALAVEGDIVWAGTEGGVVRWNRTEGTYNKYTTTDGLAHNAVYAIAIDSNGHKWFGTGDGVSEFDGTTWTTYNTMMVWRSTPFGLSS